MRERVTRASSDLRTWQCATYNRVSDEQLTGSVLIC